MPFYQLKRREFIALLGGAAAAWPLPARAQQAGNVYRVAVVRTSGLVADMTEAGDNPSFRAFFQELRRLGYVVGQNLIVERYSGEGHQERYSELAHEVVRTEPHLIVAVSTPLVLIFKAVTDKIPVIGVMADPVAYGVVSNLARPGGNITGVSVDAGLETWAKRLQLLQEVVPTAAKVGYLNLRPRWRAPRRLRRLAWHAHHVAPGCGRDRGQPAPARGLGHRRLRWPSTGWLWSVVKSGASRAARHTRFTSSQGRRCRLGVSPLAARAQQAGKGPTIGFLGRLRQQCRAN